MFLDKQTFDKFGYYPNDLFPSSHRKVVWKCDICGLIKIQQKKGSRNVCFTCSHKLRFLNRKNFCVDCGLQITLNAKRCIKCEHENKTFPINKCLNCGVEISLRAKRCVRCSLKNKVSLPKNTCVECGKDIVVRKALRCRTCANRLIAKNNIGRKPSHGKYNFYKKQWFHSTWESQFAKWCDLSGIKWEYEPRSFYIKKLNSYYWPDFYLPEFDCYIEIKGWWREDAKIKFCLFKQYYSKTNIKVFNQEVLKEIGVLK